MLRRIADALRRFRKSQDGAVAIYIGLIIFVLLGMGALASEIGLVLFKRQQQQTAADAAAYSAAIALSKGQSLTSITNEAKAIAASAKGTGAPSGFVEGVDGVTIAVNNPPTTPGSQHLGDATAVEVIIQQPQTLSITDLVTTEFGTGPLSWNVSARAVATSNPNVNCMLVLGSGEEVLTLENNAAIQPTGPSPSDCRSRCGVVVNSTSPEAIELSNNSSINGPVSVGGSSTPSNVGFKCPPVKTSPAVPDPFVQSGAKYNLSPPPLSQCQTYTSTITTNRTLNPGCYINVRTSNNLTLSLNSGTYFFVATPTYPRALVLGNQVTINANAPGGTTLIFTASASNVGSSSGWNGGVLNITAPTDGNYQGLALAVAPNTPAPTFKNNTQLNVNGAIYYPTQTFTIDNNSVINQTACNQIVANKIVMENNSIALNSNCSIPISGGAGNTQLVE
jgi:Flp pilus assembly protein TadG